MLTFSRKKARDRILMTSLLPAVVACKSLKSVFFTKHVGHKIKKKITSFKLTEAAIGGVL